LTAFAGDSTDADTLVGSIFPIFVFCSIRDVTSIGRADQHRRLRPSSTLGHVPA